MAGRPAKYETPEELQQKVDEYFEFVKSENEPTTITGLVLFLGFADRQSLYDYGEREGFSCIIKTARTRVEHGYERCLFADKPTGAIFALKNMGWKDKTEQEITMDANMNVSMSKQEAKDISDALENDV